MRKICCFAGHSELYNDANNIKPELSKKIEDLIINENVTEFWAGNYGDFDGLSANAVKNLKEKYPDIQINLVIPYTTKIIKDLIDIYKEDYDNILIADIPENTPKKLHIIKCNEYMIKKSDFLIAYVNHSWGGAAITLEFAAKQPHIKIFNIAK